MTHRVLILSNDPQSEAEFGALVREVGGWIVGSVPVAEGAQALAASGPVDAIVADLRGDEAFAPLAAITDTPIVAEIDVDAIDAAVAWLDGRLVQLLVDPDPIDRAAAIAVALGRPESGVRDQAAPGLRQLSEEAGRIARALADLAAASATVHPAPPGPQGAPAPAVVVRSIIRKRRLRERFFAAEIFSDPAWDILLDLYAARLEGARVSVSSLCIAACVPMTTALRCIRSLTDQGLLVRIADPDDGRRIFIGLSDAAADRMGAYLAASG